VWSAAPAAAGTDTRLHSRPRPECVDGDGAAAAGIPFPPSPCGLSPAAVPCAARAPGVYGGKCQHRRAAAAVVAGHDGTVAGGSCVGKGVQLHPAQAHTPQHRKGSLSCGGLRLVSAYVHPRVPDARRAAGRTQGEGVVTHMGCLLAPVAVQRLCRRPPPPGPCLSLSIVGASCAQCIQLPFRVHILRQLVLIGHVRAREEVTQRCGTHLFSPRGATLRVM
jgi:hypothetical protein